MLNFFPEKITFDNYQRLIEEHYIEIGITEYLGESMKRIAKKLDQSFDVAFLPHRKRPNLFLTILKMNSSKNTVWNTAFTTTF